MEEELPQQLKDVIANPVSFFNSFDPEMLPDLFEETDSSDLRQNAILLSVSSLFIFIIENFTGPPIVKDLNQTLLSKLTNVLPKDFEYSLNLNGEYLHTQVKAKEFIWIAFTLAQKFRAPKLWLARTAMTLQRCLTGLSPTLKAMVIPNLDGLELALAYHLYHEYKNFFDQLEAFRASINFEFHLTGKLGKKTKFQQDSKAQFILNVLDCESIRHAGQQQQEPASLMNLNIHEREVKLDEDANLLERPKMDEEFNVVPLSEVEMAYLLQEARAIQERNLGDEIRDEKSMPILTTILELKPSYDIITCAIFDKCIIEQHEHSTQPRAALQLQAIIDDFAKPAPIAIDRLNNIFLIEHPPLWDVKREMGLQMMKIGAARTGAQIFIENQMWNELGICCDIAGDANIAIPALEKTEQTPLVLTILGELKKDKELLERAWEISKQHSSRAKRSLARLYLKDEDWVHATENYEIALQLNPLYPDAQFSMGCAFMRLENYPKAVSAFQEVVSQKGDDSECFSNLAICFTTIGKHQEAHKAITQAIRFTRDNAKIWENYMIISMNAEKFNDATFGMEEINRIYPKWCNAPLIYEIMDSLLKHKQDIKRFIAVMEKISQTADCGFDFWTIYADIACAMKDFESELEMRNNVIKALEGDEKISDAAVFDRLASAVEKYVAAAKNVEGKQRAARTRIRVTLKKYEDDFAMLDSYKSLLALSEQ